MAALDAVAKPGIIMWISTGEPSFGPTMINSIVQKQLQGEILREWRV